MEDLLLHALTETALGQYLADPTHAVLLVAPEGSGKRTLSFHAAAKLLDVESGKVTEHQFVRVVLPEKDKTSISIESVRELQHFTKLKVADADARRIILIPDAHTMTTEAQNALLKLLEEPPAQTLFILTAANEQQLLATVRSRTQKLEVRRPSRQASEQYFATRGFAQSAVQQAFLMSGGLTGLMHALLSDAEHPLKASVQTARQLLGSQQFERLCKVDELSKNRTEALQVLFVLRQMASAAIEKATNNQAIKRWRNILQASYDAESALLGSTSAKLTLTNLMLAL